MKKDHRRIHIQDLSEIFLGSTLLAYPVAMSDETKALGNDLPGLSIIAIVAMSLMIITWYNYHTHYEANLRTHRSEFMLRIVATYSITLFVAAIILTVLNLLPLLSNPMLTVKLIIIVAAPASASASIVDSLK